MTAPFSPEAMKWPPGNRRAITLGERAHIMGILNVTPDSFSDGGNFERVDAAVAQARAMVRDGASIIDIGAESTRPGASAITAETEQARLLPVVEAVRAALPDVLISIDTYRSGTGELALLAGGDILNDVWGLQRDPAVAEVAARHGAGLVIMHTNREREAQGGVIADQLSFAKTALDIAAAHGVASDAIVLDPGFGFGKDEAHNLQLMAQFSQLKALGHPLLVGTSRKRFLGHLTGRDAAERDVATAATSALLRVQGAAVFRVHDVAINRDALVVADAMLAAQQEIAS